MAEKLYSNKTPGADLLADADWQSWGQEGPSSSQLQAIRFALRVYGGVPLARDLPRAIIQELPAMKEWPAWIRNVGASQLDTSFITLFPVKPKSVPQRTLSNAELLQTLNPVAPTPRPAPVQVLPIPQQQGPTARERELETLLARQLSELHLTENALAQSRVEAEELIKQLDRKPFLVRYAHPELPPDLNCTGHHCAFPEFLAAVAAGLNVLLVGPAGCGKTHMASQAAAALNLPFEFTGAVPNEFKLSGFLNANGNYITTGYRRMYEHGGLFLLDEIDASSASALLYTNSGLSNRMQDFPDGVIPRHANFRFCASANTFGMGADQQYVGRNKLDAASLDRYYVMSIDYDEKLEMELYGKDADSISWVRTTQSIRKECRSSGIKHIVSTRAIQQGIALLGTDVPVEAVMKAVIWRYMDDNLVKRIRANAGVPH